MKAVFAPPGSFIPGTGVTLKVGEIRGVRSAGMLLSAREMGLGDDHAGIVELPDGRAGRRALRHLGRARRPGVRRSASRPNRGDCFSVRGIARDLAAAGLGTLKPWRAARGAAGVRWRPALADRLAGGVPVDPRPHHPRACATGPARNGCRTG